MALMYNFSSSPVFSLVEYSWAEFGKMGRDQPSLVKFKQSPALNLMSGDFTAPTIKDLWVQHLETKIDGTKTHRTQLL